MATSQGQKNDDLGVMDAMEKQMSEPAMFRVASLFKEDEPMWTCFNHEIGKKSCVEKIAQLILFGGMIAYIVYQLTKYFDTEVNRKDFVDIDLVDTMPYAFIYIDYEINDTDCYPKFGFYNESSLTFNDSLVEEWKFSGNASYWSTQDVIDYVDSRDDCKGVYVQRTVSGGDEIQFLYIPSKCGKIEAASKDYHYARFSCVETPQTPKYIWVIAGNREEFYYHDTLDDILWNYYFQSSDIDFDYDITYIYDWFAYANEIDSESELRLRGELYDYFDINLNGAFDNTLGELYAGLTTLTLKFSPSSVGLKTTFRTTSDIDLLDVFGLAGGMYASIEQILAYFTVAFIWGCSFGCWKLSGVASEAGPDGLIRQQLEGFLKARDETIVELTQRIVELENRLDVDGPPSDEYANGKKPRKSTRGRTDHIYMQTASPQNRAMSPKKTGKMGAVTEMQPMDIADGDQSDKFSD